MEVGQLGEPSLPWGFAGRCRAAGRVESGGSGRDAEGGDRKKNYGAHAAAFACHAITRGRSGYPHGVQELLGHSDVSTTMIYTHVLNRPGVSVLSPLVV